MNSILKPVWTMKPATMAAVTGVMVLPVAGLVALNVAEEVIGPEVLSEQPQPKLASEQKLSSEEHHISNRLESTRKRAEVLVEAESVQQDTAIAVLPANPAAPTVTPTARQHTFSGGSAKVRKRAIGLAAPQNTVGIVPVPAPSQSLEKYTAFDDSPVKSVATTPVSTFSIDVDTASYARVRAALNAGNLPPKDMVRVEEMINYFDYSYPLAETRDQPFKPTISIMPTPWNEHTKLMHIGIQGFDVERIEQPKSNLVFLLDVSGSMNHADKLPLLIKSFRLLLQKLNPEDTVSIVTYAGRAATVLEPTKAAERDVIVDALNNLQAGGSTGGAQGIEQAYRLAKKNFVKHGVNRVMLATDGDFNVGISDPNQLKDFIAKKRKSGIFLSVFGFGRGNYNDALMQSLAQNGNGQAAYIDTLAEAQKALVEEAGSTLFPIATDVKIQMEFNPAKIAEYRLIGYETRALKREDFNNDKVDAGDIGAGHSVTAIYEITPVGSPAVLNDPLRYGEKKVVAGASEEIGFLKMRYKLPGESQSKLITTPLVEKQNDPVVSNDARFSVAVAAFGQKLRGQSAVSEMTYEDIAAMAQNAKGGDPFGYRSAFIQLVRMAGSLSK